MGCPVRQSILYMHHLCPYTIGFVISIVVANPFIELQDHSQNWYTQHDNCCI